MKNLKAVQVCAWISMSCACKKPQPEKRVVTITTTTFDSTIHTESVSHIEVYCKKCKRRIYEKAKK